MMTGGWHPNDSAANLLRRAARDIDSLTFTLGQWRDAEERDNALRQQLAEDRLSDAYDEAEAEDQRQQT